MKSHANSNARLHRMCNRIVKRRLIQRSSHVSNISAETPTGACKCLERQVTAQSCRLDAKEVGDAIESGPQVIPIPHGMRTFALDCAKDVSTRLHDHRYSHRSCPNLSKGPSSMSSLDPLLNIHEVAKLLSVSPRTVARLVASGNIESIHIGRTRRVRPSAVSRYVDNLQKSEREKAVGF